MKQTSIDISLIIPIFNEEKTIPELFKKVNGILRSLNKSYEIIFVNDGSKDDSFTLLQDIYTSNKDIVRVVSFSRNFGHQLALTAGFRHCRGKAAIVMDADLQDPPEMIEDFIREWESGYKIVYGQRKVREGETFFKKFTAKVFYRIMRLTTNFDIPENVGDFYLLDRKVIDILNELNERHRFMRGLVAWVGFKRKGLEYIRKPRHAGMTHYGFWRMVKFSFDAITSFSFAPLRIVSALGAMISIFSFATILLIIYLRLFTDVTIIGWSSTLAVILFIGGVQLLATGIIGEYVARIGDDVKSRPLYAIEEVLE